jgi:hypothetical protein
MKIKIKATENEEDFIWHLVPGMKSPVALNSVTKPYSMHLPPLIVLHLKPHFRLFVRFYDYIPDTGYN